MKDMTTGNPVKLIVNFAIPMLIGNLFQQVYNIVDTVIVGRYLGEEALAGVGSTSNVIFFSFAFIYGICNGAEVIIAQCFGIKDKKRISEAITALMWVAGIMTVTISLIGFFGARSFLTFLNVPANAIGYATDYVRIMFTFVFGSVIYNASSCILRSIGDSKTPLCALTTACLLNVVLDIVFVVLSNWGVKGVAYATVISQIVSAMVALFGVWTKREVLGLKELKLFPRKQQVILLFRTGFPAAFQSCMISLGGMSVQRLVNSHGSSVMAAFTAANKVDSIAIQVIVSVGTALAVFTGQNISRENYKRIHEALKKTLVIMLFASVGIACLVLIFRWKLMGLFLDPKASQQAVEIGATYLSIIGVAYVIAGIMQSYQNVIRGAGDVNTCMVAGLTELAGRIVFAYLLSHFLGATGIWIATPISWGCGCVIPVMRYYSGKWKEKKLV